MPHSFYWRRSLWSAAACRRLISVCATPERKARRLGRLGTLDWSGTMSPPIANFVKDAGHDTVEKFTEFVTGGGEAPIMPAPKGLKGRGGREGFELRHGTFSVVVAGGVNNNYWSMGGMRNQKQEA